MKRLGRWLGAFLLGLILTACGQEKTAQEPEQGLQIVTSFYPIYALTKEVSGDVNTVTMINSTAGIHDFEPSVADVRAIYDADVFLYHSHILESWAGRLDPNLEQSDVKVLEAATTLPLERVEGLENFTPKPGMDESSLYDPHTWLDPMLVGQEAVAIAELLSQLDPANRATYEKNAQTIQAEAQALTDKLMPVFSDLEQKTFVTQHTAFSYMARRFGLKQLGITSVSAEEPSPRQLAEIKTFIETYEVKTIFTESGVSDKLAKSLASSTGVQFKELNTLETDPQTDQPFLANLEANLMILAEALKEEK